MPIQIQIQIKRAYDPPASKDGRRILVDGLWPRGLSKEKLKIDEWMKGIAPSADLRKWYGHEVNKWPEFRDRYRLELSKSPRSELLRALGQRARKGRVTLVIGARDTEHANGAVIAELINERL
ncbi:MAG: DUF488 domain-containing protein [Candidatus Acidiferrales bacterium]